MFTTIKNNAQVKLIPMLDRKEIFEISLGFGDVFSAREFPSLGETMDVRVDGEARDSETLCDDDLCGLVAHAREFFELLECLRDLATVLRHEDFRKL